MEPARGIDRHLLRRGRRDETDADGVVRARLVSKRLLNLKGELRKENDMLRKCQLKYRKKVCKLQSIIIYKVDVFLGVHDNDSKDFLLLLRYLSFQHFEALPRFFALL